MRKRAITITGIFALTLAPAGCKQETGTPEPVRPVFTTCSSSTLPVEHCIRGQCRTSIHDEYWVPRARAVSSRVPSIIGDTGCGRQTYSPQSIH